MRRVFLPMVVLFSAILLFASLPLPGGAMVPIPVTTTGPHPASHYESFEQTGTYVLSSYGSGRATRVAYNATDGTYAIELACASPDQSPYGNWCEDHTAAVIDFHLPNQSWTDAVVRTKMDRENRDDAAKLRRTDSGYAGTTQANQEQALAQDGSWEEHSFDLSGCTNQIQLRLVASGPMRVYVDLVEFHYPSGSTATTSSSNCPSPTTYWCESETCPPTTTTSPTCPTTTITHQATLDARLWTCQPSTTTVNLPATIETTPTAPTPSPTETTGRSGTVELPSLAFVVSLVVLALVGLAAARNRD